MQQSQAKLHAFTGGAHLESTRFYMGNLMSFLAKDSETGGRVALVEVRVKPGNEPPPHIHEWEHELYYVLEGELEFYCGVQVLTAKAGESVFLPCGIAHAFYVRSPLVRTLLLVVAAGEHAVGLDRYFTGMSEPATSLRLPTETVTYAMVDLDHAIKWGLENGVTLLSPEQTARALPGYPGFGITPPAR